MNRLNTVFTHRVGRVVCPIVMSAVLVVAGTTSLSFRSAFAAPRGGSKSAPTKEVQVPPLELVDGPVTFDLRKIKSLLKKGEKLETELFTKNKKSYAGALADFYALIDTLCYVTSVSGEMVIAQECALARNNLAQGGWSSAISYLSVIAQGGVPDSAASESYAQFAQNNPGTVYLIINGHTVVPTTVRDLPGVTSGTGQMPDALPIEFEGCSFEPQATGNQLSKVCASALPVPPLRIESKKGKLVFTRQTDEEASAFVQISTRAPEAKNMREKGADKKGKPGTNTKKKPVVTVPVLVKKRPSSSGASSSAPYSDPSSEDASEASSASSESNQIYACMCDGKDASGKIVRAASSPPDSQADCDAFCPASQQDKDGWCTKTDGLGTKFKVRNCKWELTDPPTD